MIGRIFTWENSLSEPTYEKLDRVLMDTDWESKFLLVSVRALERIEDLSDHAPILLTTGLPRPPCTRRFKFELGWLQSGGLPGYGQKNLGKTCCRSYPNSEVEQQNTCLT